MSEDRLQKVCRVANEFFRGNPKEKTMQVTREFFDEYLVCLQESQRQQAKISETVALIFFGGKRYLEVKP